MNPLLQQLLQSHRILGEFRDTLTQLVDGHGVFVEVKAEGRLVVEIGALGNIKPGSTRRVKLPRDGGGGVVKLLQEGRLRDNLVSITD